MDIMDLCGIWVCYTALDMPYVVWHIRPGGVWCIFGVFTMIKFHTIICCGIVNPQYNQNNHPLKCPVGRVVLRDDFGHFKIVLFSKVQVGAHLVFFKIWYTDLYGLISFYHSVCRFILYKRCWKMCSVKCGDVSSIYKILEYLYIVKTKLWVLYIWNTWAAFVVFSVFLQWLKSTP